MIGVLQQSEGKNAELDFVEHPLGEWVNLGHRDWLPFPLVATREEDLRLQEARMLH